MVHTILVIDRDPAQRDMLANSLRNRLGYLTVSSPSAQDSFDMFRTDPSCRPDLIFYDWSAIAGGDAASSVTALSIHAPVVVLVKYGDYDAGIAALNAGAQDFLTKPVAMERISTTFRNLLLLKDACREAEQLRGERIKEATGVPAAGRIPPVSLPSFSLVGSDGNIRRMEDIESEVIRFAMQYYHGRMTEVARRLGIGRSTLYRKLSGFGARQQEAA